MNIARTILAAALMFLVLLTIPSYLDFIGVQTEQSENSSIADKEQPTNLGLKMMPETQPQGIQVGSINEQIIKIKTDFFELQLSNRAGGSILDYRLIKSNQGELEHFGSYDPTGKYDVNSPVLLHSDLLHIRCSPCLSVDGRTHLINEPFLLMTPINSQDISLSGNETLELHYRFENSLGDFVDKYILFSGNSYNIDSTVDFDLKKTFPSQNIELSWLSGILPAERMEADELSYSGAYVSFNGNVDYINQPANIKTDQKEYNDEKTDWLAIRNKFFAVSLFPNTPSEYSTLSSSNILFGDRSATPIYEASLGYKMNQGRLDFVTYLGPLDIESVEKFNPDLKLIMNFGWSIIQPFSKLVLWLLKTMRDSLGMNYGLILILFAFLMRVVTGPLTKKSYESSIKMKEVAPLQKEIQEKYKNDPQKLQQELGKLWKKHGFNPAMSCVAPLLQMPLLMSFFIVFRSTVEFRGQPFILWVKDLSQPDYIFNLPFSIPMYGSAVAILPILMGVSMFLTMRMSMQSAEDSQKYVMYFMNGFFILIFNTFPSGLTLYYTVYNFLSYQQQLSIKKNN